MENQALLSSLSKKKVEFDLANRETLVIPDTPIETAIRSLKITSQPDHKHELVTLSHMVKRRLRKLIRQLQNKKYSLQLKRSYKRSADQRKSFRRNESQRRKKDLLDGLNKSVTATNNGSRKTPQNSSEDQQIYLKESSQHLKPSKPNQNWRENKYRKWKQTRHRANFTRQEKANRLFDHQHPGTRPFIQSNFGCSKSEDSLRKSQMQRLSVRWSKIMFPAGTNRSSLEPIPRVDPYMKQILKPNTKKEAGGRLKVLLKDDWDLKDSNSTQRGVLVRAMAGLIVQAKERYDSEQRQNQTSGSLSLCKS
jgi:hypothetical protein